MAKAANSTSDKSLVRTLSNGSRTAALTDDTVGLDSVASKCPAAPRRGPGWITVIGAHTQPGDLLQHGADARLRSATNSSGLRTPRVGARICSVDDTLDGTGVVVLTSLPTVYHDPTPVRLYTEDRTPPIRAGRRTRRLGMSRPQARLIRTPRDAEEVVRDWLRYWGFTDALLTPVGVDGGIDVEAAELVVQVKAEMRPIGRPIVQNIYGVASSRGVRAAVFALSGFTENAQKWAGEVGVALFGFNWQGEPQALNQAAEELTAAGSVTSKRAANEAYSATVGACGDAVDARDDLVKQLRAKCEEFGDPWGARAYFIQAYVKHVQPERRARLRWNDQEAQEDLEKKDWRIRMVLGLDPFEEPPPTRPDWRFPTIRDADASKNVAAKAVLKERVWTRGVARFGGEFRGLVKIDAAVHGALIALGASEELARVKAANVNR